MNNPKIYGFVAFLKHLRKMYIIVERQYKERITVNILLVKKILPLQR